MQRSRCLILVVDYQAEAAIENLIPRVPASLSEHYDVEILIIDDSSATRTFEKSNELAGKDKGPFRIHVLSNPINQGYGGNQKLGYHFAIKEGYDLVALLPGDGQYAPEHLPYLLKPLEEGRAAAVFASRKYVGNKILTWLQRRLLCSRLNGVHSGFRIYSVRALEAIPFEYNSNDFHFDTEIVMQLLIAQLPIVELPLPTSYGAVSSRVNGLSWALSVLKSTIQARLQELSLFYDRKYDCAAAPLSQYAPKFGFNSPHSFVLKAVPANSRVLDLGCGSGYVGFALQQKKKCRVTGVDARPLRRQALDDFRLHDLNVGLAGIAIEEYDFVLLLDVIEHLAAPEKLLDDLRRGLSLKPEAELIISTGNVGFVITRLMLLLGNFNYGKRGILDLTHTRLFTFSSMLRTLRQAGFTVVQTAAIPAPFPLALGDNAGSRFLLACNEFLTHLSRGLFAYQMIVRVKARPTLEALLRAAQDESQTGRNSRSAASAAQ
jgi:2-polyprenyl-3-methyl-5-hydroxy-6-metoxy-1,4-benzoquinol methylase